MDFKKNIYLVLTEYQFLQALNIATSVYSSSDYINCIYIVRNGHRMNAVQPIDNGLVDNIKLHIFHKVEPKIISEYILNEKPNHFLFFQAISPLNVHLASKLKGRGAEISLGPDGYQAYATFNKKHHFLSIVKDSLKNNTFMIKNKLLSLKFHRFDYYTYGNQNFIDNLWITHPDQYVHKAKNVVNILKLPNFNQKCIKLIENYFNFADDFPIKDAIYFFNQPLWSNLLDKEFTFLRDVVKNFPQKQIIIKLHPTTNLETKEKFKSLAGLKIIDSPIPAEVILLSLQNCIVFSGWSSALVTENDSCNYYFNYPIYKDLNDLALNQLDIEVLDHIKLIHSPKEMKFPNE